MIDKLGIAGHSHLGVRPIPLDAIVGSVGRYQDFTRTFLPRSKEDEDRWVSVGAAATSVADLPPIQECDELGGDDQVVGLAAGRHGHAGAHFDDVGVIRRARSSRATAAASVRRRSQALLPRGGGPGTDASSAAVKPAAPVRVMPGW